LLLAALQPIQETTAVVKGDTEKGVILEKFKKGFVTFLEGLSKNVFEIPNRLVIVKGQNEIHPVRLSKVNLKLTDLTVISYITVEGQYNGCY